jgi:predicted dehydrogenase
MMRFHSYHQKIREIILSGAIGEVVSARSQFTCWYPEIENCWRQNKALSGGGAMLDMGNAINESIHTRIILAKR